MSLAAAAAAGGEKDSVASSASPPPPMHQAPLMRMSSAALSPSTWARASVPMPYYSMMPTSSFVPASASSSPSYPPGRFSEPLTLRGMNLFVRAAIALHLCLWLVRDASLLSFMLYSGLLTSALFFLIVRGEPFSLALLVESATSVQNKADGKNTPPAVPAQAPFGSPVGSPMSYQQQQQLQQQMQQMAQQQQMPVQMPPVIRSSSSAIPSSAASSSSSTVVPAFAFKASPVSSLESTGSASSSSTSSPRNVSLASPTNLAEMEPLSPVSAISSSPPALVMAPEDTPAAAAAGASSVAAAATASPHAAGPTESTPVVVAGATSRHSSTDADMSWTRAAGQSYDVRIGPNYKKYGKKAPSRAALFECVGCDVFGAPDGKLDHVAQHLQLPWIARKSPAQEAAQAADPNFDPYLASTAPPTKPHDDASPPAELDPVHRASDSYEVDPAILAIDAELGVPTLFIVNFQIPTYAPGYFSSKEDGEGFSILLYYQITKETRAEIRSGKVCGAIELFKEFVMNAHEFEYHSRFKAIPRIVNPQEAKVGVATRTAMRAYNSKPFLTGPHCHSFIRGQGYMEADIDVHRFCLSARKGAYGTLDALASLIVDVGFVVEAGRNGADEELPEQILACGRIAHLDPMHAKSLKHFIEIGKKERAKRMAAK